MKKIIALTLAVVMMLGLLAGCGAKNEADTTDYSTMTIEELKPLIKTLTAGKLTMVTSPDFAPYEFYALDENGTPLWPVSTSLWATTSLTTWVWSWRSSPWTSTAPSLSWALARPTSAWLATPLTPTVRTL